MRKRTPAELMILRRIPGVAGNYMMRTRSTQRDLARYAGIAEAMLCRYLKGKSVPDLSALVRLAKALEIDPSYFLADHGLTEAEWRERRPRWAVEPQALDARLLEAGRSLPEDARRSLVEHAEMLARLARK